MQSNSADFGQCVEFGRRFAGQAKRMGRFYPSINITTPTQSTERSHNMTTSNHISINLCVELTPTYQLPISDEVVRGGSISSYLGPAAFARLLDLIDKPSTSHLQLQYCAIR